jgi:cell division protein FtsI (penicillin-binding protein 3)
MLTVAAGLSLATLTVSGQLVRLGLSGSGDTRTTVAEPITSTVSRPDIVDRKGRLVAADVPAHSLFADPSIVLDRDEVAERLAKTLPGIEAEEIRRLLADRTRRFVWIRRGLAPLEAQRVHDLGLPGLAFRREPKRAYPGGTLVGHIVGQVNPDNRGITGIERHVDEVVGITSSHGAFARGSKPIRLSIDLGAQHVVADELAKASIRFQAAAASGLVMDASTGEIVAAASWPPIDPNIAGAHLDPERPDRLQGGVYELGSIFKALTVAMALDDGVATLDKTYDVTRPLTFGRHKIRDLHPQGRPLTVRDIFLHSSNVGAAMLGIEAGSSRQLVFLARIGLLEPIRTEIGPVAPPLLPQSWGEIETATISYGHGLALAPLQMAAAAAILVNGGRRVLPTYLVRDERNKEGDQILSPATSIAMRELMRLNVTVPYGTGRRAEVAAYRVGGKTGTAEMPGKGGYQAKSVISSFLGAFPMDAPRYVLMVTLFEPKSAEDSKGGITAGLNAAPLTAAIVERIAPILGVLPRRIETIR